MNIHKENITTQNSFASAKFGVLVWIMTNEVHKTDLRPSVVDGLHFWEERSDVSHGCSDRRR